MSTVQILIADDHELVRRSLRSLVESHPNWRVCAEAADGFEAFEKTKQMRPDVVLMDMSMPRMDGAEATRKILREVPESQVIIVSQNDPALMRKLADEVGARAYVSKANLVQDLIPAILKVVNGNNHSTPPEVEPPAKDLHDDWLFGGGSLAVLIRQYDWSRTQLGPLHLWPQSLRTAVNLMLNSQHPIWIGWGPEMQFLYNEPYIQVLSWAKHPWALGRPAREVWAEIWDVCGPLADKVFSKAEPSFVDDVRLFMNRGDYLEETYYSFSYSPIYDESGKVAGLFCPSTEITSKILNARRLRTLSELSAKSLIEKSISAACSTSIQIISRNPDDIPFALLYLLDDQKTARLEGSCHVPEGLDHVSPRMITLDRHGERLLWPIRELAEGGEARTIPLAPNDALPSGPAQQRVRQAIALPVASAAMDRPVGVLIAGVNPSRKLDLEYRTFFTLLADQLATAILDARALQQEKERADALMEIDRAKTAFFSNVSHEFRTPLTLMMGPLEDTLAEPEGLSREHRERLEVAHRNSTRLLRLVNTLLDFSRIEAGRMEAFYEPTDLSKLTAELASVFRSAIERADLRLVINCPPIAEPVYVDREMWEKIVLNLLSNAFKFTFEGEIEVSLHTVDGAAELSVRDTGTGIPEQELPHLFERFHRVKGARGRTFEGSGIGLSLVQELARLHGGAVRAESQISRGTTFTVSIPLGKEHLPVERRGTTRVLESTGLRGVAYAQEAMHWIGGETTSAIQLEAFIPPAKSAPQPQPGSEKSAHVLIADDNADMRSYLQNLLRGQYEIEAVADGEAALKSARARRPDLILSDVMMPRMDGFSLLQAVRADESLRTIPFILVSARAGEEARIEGVQSGADDYLVKPFSARELLARVGSHIAMAKLRREAEEVERQARLNAELLAAIVASSDDAIISKGLDGTITSWNTGAQRMYGYTAEEAIGRHITLIVPEDRREEEERILAGLRNGQRFDHFLTVRQRKDGTTLEVSLTISPIRDPAGRVIGASKIARDVSVERRAERAVRESEQRQRALLNATSSVVYRMSPDWREMRQLDGRGLISDTEIPTGKWLDEYIHPDDQPTVLNAIEDALRTKSLFELEHRVRQLDGTLGWTLSRAVPILDEKGEIVEWFGTASDVTARKQAEETLRQERERFDVVAEAAQVGFWFCDLPFDKLVWDERVKEHFWLAPDADVTIGAFYERIHPDDRERTRQAIEESIGRDTPYDIEYRTVSPDGGEKWIRATGRTFYDAAGRPQSFDGLTFDITQRKRAEERERQMTAEAIAATAKFRAVFEQTTVFAGIMTKDGIVVEANRMCLDACGYRAEEVLGRQFWETGWWRNSKEARDKIRAATPLAAKGTPYREILEYSWADGTKRLVDFALYPIVDDKGEILFLHPTGVDITDLKRAEENARKLAETLEAEVRARTSELEDRNADVLRQSEQLRNLSRSLLQTQDEERRHIARELHDSAGQTLTVLGLSLAQMAEDAKKTAPELGQQAQGIQELVQQLHQEIRTTSYLLHPPLLDEAGLSSALNWYVQGIVERSGLEIGLSIAEDFGRLPRDMELVVFRLVQECLTNIHRHSGSKTASIRVARGPDEITVDVRDQGRGMSLQRLAEIQSGGSGVGIRGMRERLRQFEGRLTISSDGTGTECSVSIPTPKIARSQAPNKIEPSETTA
jgi:PAS domain S-box-containing protein